ncbi:Uncharacterized protein FKW44_021152, partial [Caligus rogercresseyi]
WKTISIDFAGTPKLIGHTRLFAPRSEAGLGLINIEVHWALMTFSWYKRAHLVDFPWSKHYWASHREDITRGTNASPWKEIAPGAELISVYWRKMGANGPLVGNPEIKVSLPRGIREEAGLVIINDVLSVSHSTNTGVIILKKSLQGAFQRISRTRPLKEAMNVGNRQLREGLTNNNKPFDLIKRIRPQGNAEEKRTLVKLIFDPLLTSKQSRHFSVMTLLQTAKVLVCF